MNYTITTDRLGLRNWVAEDFEPFHAMNRDQKVMEFFPKLMAPEDTLAFISRMQNHFNVHGFCYFAVEKLENKEFIGMIGMLHQSFESKYTPCVDIGWRLKRSSWGQGFASEGAMACLHAALNTFDLKEIYSFAPLINEASIKVMQKIGMKHIGQFEHPKLGDYPLLRGCTVYKAKKIVEYK